MKAPLPLAELQALFRQSPAFRRVFMADVATQFGDGGLFLAFPLLILELTRDVTLTGLAFSGEILAIGLLSPLAGYWADRLDQKRVMMAADLVRMALLGALLLAVWVKIPLALLLGLSIALGAAGAFFIPARAAFLRRLLDGADLERAIALEGTASFLLRLVSPAMMGLLLAVLPAAAGVGVAIATYGVAVVLLTPGWVSGRTIQVPLEDTREAWKEGWRTIARQPALRGLLAVDTMLCLVGMAAFSITIAFLDQALREPAQANGWLLATTGLAGAIGTQLADRIRRLGPSRLVYAGLTLAIAATYLAVPHAPSLPAMAAMWFLRGLAIGAFCVLINQQIARETPAEVMGRVQAAWGLATCFAAFAGSAATPWLLRTLGAGSSYSLFGLALVGLAGWQAAPLGTRLLRRLLPGRLGEAR